MGLLLSYSLRSIAARRLSASLTVLGMALVVFVFAAVLMLAHGLESTLVATGSDWNAIVIRAASTSETVSILMRDDAGVVMTQPEVAVAPDGGALAVHEIVVLISGEKRKNGEPANIVIRGTEPQAFAVRPDVKLTAGRAWTPGTSEVIAGRSIAGNFRGCGLGEQVDFAGRAWRVVGLFDAGGSGFDSELWGDVEQVQQAFRRPIYSSVTFRLKEPAQFDGVRNRLESDPRLAVDVQREKAYYAKQSVATATFIRVLGLFVTILFALGAMVGAMITMYAAVSNRIVEIGTMRALGFSRGTVLRVFLAEALWLGLLGGALGVAAASFLSLITVSTTNWDTFSELAFGFALSPRIAFSSLLFAAIMGVVGGFLPAMRAARAEIVQSLRQG
jgi:ABC-type antimicrobial peptide transport system permease subunit